MQEQKGHIYIYGELTDYLTGKTLPDTDDERIRQSLARLLVEERGFCRSELLSDQKIITSFSGQRVTSDIDIVVRLQEEPLLLLRCAPGSLVSRERPAIAAGPPLRPPVSTTQTTSSLWLLSIMGGTRSCWTVIAARLLPQVYPLFPAGKSCSNILLQHAALHKKAVPGSGRRGFLTHLIKKCAV